jgi:hypothetical protein
VAKSPVYGKLQIFDRTGKKAEKGINVGNEWEYRGYIEGGTPGVQTRAAAIWTFTGVTEEKYPKGLPLEMTLRVFRSYKGDIERGVLGEIVIRNPNPDAKVKRSGPILFESKEFVADDQFIPRELFRVGRHPRGKIDVPRSGQIAAKSRVKSAASFPCFGGPPDLICGRRSNLMELFQGVPQHLAADAARHNFGVTFLLTGRWR